MKILHAAETIQGGVATVMRLNMLAQLQGHGVHALVPASQSAELSPVPAASMLTFNRTGRNIPSFLAFMWHLARAIVVHKPDILHLHSTFAGLLGRPVAFLLRPLHAPKVVYTPHGWSFIMQGSATRKKLYAATEKLLAPFTRHTICVSQDELATARHHGLSTTRITVIHNGVPAAAAVGGASPFKGRGPHLLFVGRFDPAKGLDILVSAMEHLQDTPAHLTVIGGGSPAEPLPANTSNITYTGWLKPAQVASYLAHATVLVVPSRWEGFAMAPLEAMSHGLPVLASNCRSLPEMVQHDKTGKLFPMADADALANIIRTTSSTEWKTMGKAARATFLKRFTAETMTSQTLSLYKNLCK